MNLADACIPNIVRVGSRLVVWSARPMLSNLCRRFRFMSAVRYRATHGVPWRAAKSHTLLGAGEASSCEKHLRSTPMKHSVLGGDSTATRARSMLILNPPNTSPICVTCFFPRANAESVARRVARCVGNVTRLRDDNIRSWLQIISRVETAVA